MCVCVSVSTAIVSKGNEGTEGSQGEQGDKYNNIHPSLS